MCCELTCAGTGPSSNVPGTSSPHPRLRGSYTRNNQAAMEVGHSSEGNKCKKRKCPKDRQLEGNRESNQEETQMSLHSGQVRHTWGSPVGEVIAGGRGGVLAARTVLTRCLSPSPPRRAQATHLHLVPVLCGTAAPHLLHQP